MIPEAAIFYALALNETALHSDKNYAKQLKAGAILEKILAKLPDHPGALHYLIHTYDYPPLAQRGLDAANRYAEVAPAAQHAQHMPSHTYSMLGMWTQSVASNTKSRAIAQEQLPSSGPGRHIQASHTIWTLRNTPCCKWDRRTLQSSYATTATL
ncbi:hypothetical protein [Bradyrhizobium sp. AUGA SZCCT0182]|uniref:hypothetical protein n=1 Tax=Bradyrhizobium sp. AUGA SZCCT0182 TaxID=2807667 RepID=UPI001BA72284|nr:hypothetical protein [Bradyrhizobium sp. AUGA SZCCT0182]MBR1232007.1 hypothetical protein [Bradyrhizobium sp. AUGA SZCCT0182]